KNELQEMAVAVGAPDGGKFRSLIEKAARSKLDGLIFFTDLFYFLYLETFAGRDRTPEILKKLDGLSFPKSSNEFKMRANLLNIIGGLRNANAQKKKGDLEPLFNVSSVNDELKYHFFNHNI